MNKRYSLLYALGIAILAGVVFSACDKDNNEKPADIGVKKAQEICDCFKRTSEAEGKACVQSVNANAEYLKYEEDADFEESFWKELEKCTADTPSWWTGEADKDTPKEAGVKKAQEICDCFKRTSEAEGKACVQSVNANAEYLKYEEDADFEESFWKELEKCTADTPSWW